MRNAINHRRRRGAALIEMTLVGIPIIFVLISIFEVSRGMWMYHTSSYAVKNGVRFASVHGFNCVPITGSVAVLNNCPTTIAGVTAIVRDGAVGLDPSVTLLTFTPGAAGSNPTSCYMGSNAGSVSGPYGAFPGCLQAIFSDTNAPWPPSDTNGTLNGVGKPVSIDIKTPFNSAIVLFWPGSRTAKFGATNLGASSSDYIQF